MSGLEEMSREKLSVLARGLLAENARLSERVAVHALPLAAGQPDGSAVSDGTGTWPYGTPATFNALSGYCDGYATECPGDAWSGRVARLLRRDDGRRSIVRRVPLQRSSAGVAGAFAEAPAVGGAEGAGRRVARRVPDTDDRHIPVARVA